MAAGLLKGFDVRLSDKTAIVTGGAGGIGRGITRAFVKEGANVLVVDINDDAGDALAAELGEQVRYLHSVSYTHLTLPTNREV